MEFTKKSHKELLEKLKTEANYCLEHQVIVKEQQTRVQNWFTILNDFFIIFPSPQIEDDQRPTNRDIIRNFTILTYSKYRDDYFKSQGIDTTCSICQSKYENKDKLLELICQHYYHKDCILKWLDRSNTCPICRCVIDDDSKIENILTKNGLRLYRYGAKIDEIFEELVESIEKKIGRWWIFNQDYTLKKRIFEIEKELILMIREMRFMVIIEKIKGLSRDIILKILRITKEIERILTKFQ